MRGEISFCEIRQGRFEVGDVSVGVVPIRHLGPTAGYRLDWQGRSIVFIPDHQQPCDGGTEVDPAVLELARGADLLIHDAQYTAEEFAVKADWGHSTVEYAVNVAERAGVGTLALFHHDPAHSDDFVDHLAMEARAACRTRSLDIFAAREGLRLVIDRARGERRPPPSSGSRPTSARAEPAAAIGSPMLHRCSRRGSASARLPVRSGSNLPSR